MNWLEISVETEAAAIETVSAILHEHGEGGVAVYQRVVPDDEDAAYHYDTARPTTVTTYVPATEEGERRRDAIAAALGHLTVFNLARIGPVQTRQVAEEDWANAWKQYYHPMRFGRHVVIKPSWRAFTPRAGDLVIELDPGMAFGTGLHQTTALCLGLLEEYVAPGMRVLDQGCGSGILSLAAARLGAARVVAVDTSEVAVEATRENAARNGLGAAIEALRGEDVPGGPQWSGPALSSTEIAGTYDLVIANIIANVIIALAPQFAAVLPENGVLICSGIIREREDEVRAALASSGFMMERHAAQDEWVALVARR
jgi:ribosomal protein L11 methyltransferase